LRNKVSYQPICSTAIGGMNRIMKDRCVLFKVGVNIYAVCSVICIT